MIEFEPISMKFSSFYGYIVDKDPENTWEFEVYDDGKVLLAPANGNYINCSLLISLADLDTLITKAKWFRDRRTVFKASDSFGKSA